LGQLGLDPNSVRSIFMSFEDTNEILFLL